MKRFGSKFYTKICKDLDLTPFQIPQKIVHRPISDSKYKTFLHKKSLAIENSWPILKIGLNETIWVQILHKNL